MSTVFPPSPPSGLAPVPPELQAPAIQADHVPSPRAALRPLVDSTTPVKLDSKRYRRISWFFVRTLLHIIWWDLLLAQPVLSWFRRPAVPRWQRIARRYRALAIEMGGVLVKLGQFLSVRVDLLPQEVTSELAGLQDEVPAQPLSQIVAQLETEFRRPVAEVFGWFSPTHIAAASMAQVHLARLPSGTPVVVKVLRPGIDVLIETDLAVLAKVLGVLKLHPKINKSIDLDWLAEEFITATRKELDLIGEGRNAERFARDFADDPQVYIPKVYWDYSSQRILTLENVGYLKVDDLEMIDAVGISRKQVAQKLYTLYLYQFFITHFLHADPHPGNIFVRPLVHPEENGRAAYLPGEPVPYRANRPFQLVFIDFGMATVIPESSREWLRDYAIGLGLRDARRIVQSYVKGGILRPGADLARLEEATAAMLDRFGGMIVGQMQDVDFREMRLFADEYRDFVYDAPFQFQADLLFLFRSMGLLAGIVIKLDPEFDLWTTAAPFARRLVLEEVQRNWDDWLHEVTVLGKLLGQVPMPVEQVVGQAERVFKMPPQVQEMLGQASWRPRLPSLEGLAPKDNSKGMQQLSGSIQRLAWALVAATLFLTGVFWHVGTLVANALAGTSSNDSMGYIFIVGAVVALFWGLIKKE